MISYKDCPICNQKLAENNFGTLNSRDENLYGGSLLERYSSICEGHHFENVVTLDEQVISATIEIPIKKVDWGNFKYKPDLILRVSNMYNEHNKSLTKCSTILSYPSNKFTLNPEVIQLDLNYTNSHLIEMNSIINFDFPNLEELKRKTSVYMAFS